MQTVETSNQRTEHTVEGNLEAVRRLFHAVEHRDREGVMAVYDENIVINEAPSLPYGGEYRGPDGALRHGLGYRATWDRFQPWTTRGLDPRFIAQGDYVVVVWRQGGEQRDWKEHRSSGRQRLPPRKWKDCRIANAPLRYCRAAQLSGRPRSLNRYRLASRRGVVFPRK